ncbi:hypothetical protein L226DRAFT_508777 [Lentinus tigrinus ALCF2SS1-7]|uniref:Uncharacterized protein n=1 Tax=Lentinus tigrinus ALCF2SS1-6 TaxID=1328759 RepID=A0A5C2SFH6_9APHY|nr:hypothetical protein L227DRAFT_43407 [Lentinus tigrinus ALCF2SS1-6]RPD74406.1 hypothetical protein L226DRAFT_508777 [Lentinus tigrinus ALCF2SS1-7]
MAHRCVRNFRLASTSRIPHVRHVHTTPSCRAALAVPNAEFSTASSSSSSHSDESPLDVIRRRKVEDIKNLLSLKTPNHNRVWGSYVELLEFFGSAKVPLEIHQSVLRKCAPPAVHVRAVFARKMAEGQRYTEDQLFESRFQRVIRNIRAAGDTPALEDYHCVLELFAAVGNYKGSMMVLREIGRVGLVKEPRTYALCLQAMCHRLTLPMWHLYRPALVEEVTEHCLDILREMSSNGVQYASYNVDLAFRILKETMNMDGFTTLLRHAYGVDLAYPDRSPLEYWAQSREASSSTEGQASLPMQIPTPLPFTLASFNTALDYLGRAGDVSKLVQTFEVITTPLPASASNSAFNDDDDDDFGVSNPQVAPYKPPHVEPNTTSYHLLLKWVAKAGHPVLARHYLLCAIEQERNQGRQLREWTRQRSPEDIPSPHLSITRGLFLPVLSVANRHKNMELLRWVHIKVRRAIRWKQFDLKFYETIRARWIESGVYRAVRNVEDDLSGDLGEDLPAASSTSQFSSFFSPSSSLRQPLNTPESDSSSPFAVDLDAPLVPPPKEPKKLDIDRHLLLLRRDLEELEEFEQHVVDVIGRDTQRVKERLGRRVWAGKDVFMRDVEQRVDIPKEVWRDTVMFRTQAEIEAKREEERRAKTKERQASLPLEPDPHAEEREEPPHKTQES